MISYLSLTTLQWAVLGLGSLFLGFSRTALRGSSFLLVPIYAQIFGGRLSVGLLLPMLIIGDIISSRHYLKDTKWPYIVRLLPWILPGLILGVLLGNSISDILFKRLIGVVVLFSIVLVFLRDFKKIELQVPRHWLFSACLGILTGFTSMVGNAAGPVMNLYFMSMGLEKNKFIGTVSWFFFIINLTKVPFHVFFWKSITLDSLAIAGIAALPIILGAFLGIWIARKIPEKPFRITILVLITIASIRLLVA